MLYNHPMLIYLSSLIIPWVIAYFVVAKKNKHVKLFEQNLGFCLAISLLLFLVSFFIIISYLYGPKMPSFLVIIMLAPIYVPPVWSLIVIIYSMQLAYNTTFDDVLDD